MFEGEFSDVKVTVGVSGTGGGFKKFLGDQADLRTDINGASRPIKPAEIKMASDLGIEFIEMPVAIDGLAVMVHPSNDFCDYLTVEELRRIWEPGSQINNWNQIRDGFPDLDLKLYGPGTDSGTFDYFTEVINGESKVSRSDYTASETDNILVVGIAGDPGALGYFGFSYYETNKEKLKLLGVDNGNGPIKPDAGTVGDGSYEPLSRPLFVYVNKQSADRPGIKAFLHYFFDNAEKIVEHPRVNYVALSDELYQAARARFDAKTTGSAYAEGPTQGANLTELFVRE
jgi:phosphate transport system substrate-binding protein